MGRPSPTLNGHGSSQDNTHFSIFLSQIAWLQSLKDKLGEPFEAWPYGGWFVPYEIRLPNGDVRKWNLAVRNDNPAHRYVVDGGL